MEDQGGAGGAPLHHHDHEHDHEHDRDERRRRGASPTAPGPKASAEDERTVRAADTDEASRLDRPGAGDGPAPERRRPGREH
ncbi:hypothetical protein BCL76_115178 [Streptomyces sp. CG 926]|uniref:hypothetical protein n=1 Tax=Streptomyces sp. CG 926 TaxID=1882405 RepID=UPI000D6B17E0|nr:hypothetical protein [Streptomyces sp. CG 926]PWK64534.1 hypothetical protein BCL76_115178 [Streptomyces sp. CG 926]